MVERISLGLCRKLKDYSNNLNQVSKNNHSLSIVCYQKDSVTRIGRSRQTGLCLNSKFKTLRDREARKNLNKFEIIFFLYDVGKKNQSHSFPIEAWNNQSIITT